MKNQASFCYISRGPVRYAFYSIVLARSASPAPQITALSGPSPPLRARNTYFVYKREAGDAPEQGLGQTENYATK